MSPKSSEDQKKVQRSFGEQMQIIVKLLEGMQSNYLGDISPQGFGNPVLKDAEAMNFDFMESTLRT